MSGAQTDDRRILNAFEAGYLAGQMKLKGEFAKRRSRRRRRTLFGWLRFNSGPLTLLMGLMASITTGAWTVYTYYRPPTNAIIEPFDSPARNRKPWPERQPTPNDKPEDLDQPGFRLLIDNVPQRNVPKPVQNVLITAADLLQAGFAPDEIDKLTAKYLATMGVGGLKRTAISVFAGTTGERRKSFLRTMNGGRKITRHSIRSSTA